MSVVVVGGGGIGGCVAAELARTGSDVVLIDSNAEHVAAIRADGLLVKGIRGEYRVPIGAACLPEEWDGVADLVLVAVKSQHTIEAVRPLLNQLTATSTVVSLQNGWNALRIAELVGPQRTVAAMMHVVGSYEAPGGITRHTEGTVYLGELDGTVSQRTGDLADLLSVAFPTESVPNVWGYIWSKQVYGATMPINALVDLPASEIYAHHWVKGILLAVVAEAVDVAVAEGVGLEAYERFDPASFRAARSDGDCAGYLTQLPRGSSKGNSGVWRDLRIHHRPSEVTHLSGELVRIGRRRGLPMDVNGTVVDLIVGIETGEREMSWDNVHALVAPSRNYLASHPQYASCLPLLESNPQYQHPS